MLCQGREGCRKFDELLEQLSRARVADEELRCHGASLVERIESRERLLCLRAALAEARKLLGIEKMSVGEVGDLRMRWGDIAE